MQDPAMPRSADQPPQSRSEDRQTSGREPLREGEDFYYEGPYMVFTEHYHRKRGSCCHSGCRHCPYKPSSS
ncbi:MAG TPA: DUF5522 domain-containing protein [Acidobacteriaceae bacterium]|nr:DUF5522 domain-containing protein [Acidobacteriaceae bacterium]